MHVFITCKKEEDPIKNEGALEWSQHYILILSCSREANSVVSSRIWWKFKLIQALIIVLGTCKNEDDPIKNEGAGVFTTFLSLQVYGDFL